MIFDSFLLAEISRQFRYSDDVPTGNLRKQMVFYLLVESSEYLVDSDSSFHISGCPCLNIEPRIFLDPFSVDNFHSDMIDHEHIGEMESDECEYCNGRK